MADSPNAPQYFVAAAAAADARSSAFSPDATVELVFKARQRDQAAIDELYRRYLPRLRQWAQTRLPALDRDLQRVNYVVGDVLRQTIERIDAFDFRHEGALQAYLRHAVDDRINAEIRRGATADAAETIDDETGRRESRLAAAIGRDNVARYEMALQRLRDRDRELVIARLEMQCTYEELATAFGYRTSEIARSAAMRAVYRLAQEIG